MTNLNYYNENLDDKDNDYDIMKVYEDYTLQNLLWERKEIKLTEDEKVILRNLPPKFKWITRDKDGTLYLFNEVEPFKECTYWRNGRDSFEFLYFNSLFQFIKWEDKEPYSIDELLKGVE